MVSDNDGSAFITKAEYDSLKNDFQAQINAYNTSIDAKIDNAIASYLAGVTVEAESNLNLKYGDWKEVVMTNFKPALTWRAPNLNLSYSQNYNLTSGNWVESAYVNGQIKYKRNENSYKKIVYVCDADVDSKTKVETNISNEPANVQWLGRAKNYQDALDVSLIYSSTSGYFNGFANSNMRLIQWARFGCNYYDNLSNSAGTIWNPLYYYISSEGYQINGNKGSSTSLSCSTSAKLGADSEGKTVDYEHMINWTNLTDFRVCDTDWLKHLIATPGFTGSDIPATSDSQTTGSGKFGGMEAWSPNGARKVTSNRNLSGYYKGNNSDTQSSSVPTIGLLSKSYESKNLYQTAENFSQVVDKTKYETTSKPILTDGFILFAANKDDKMTWSPAFKNSKKGDTEDKGNIRLYLSVGGFGDNVTLKSGSTLIKDKANENRDYFVIKDLAGKIQFEMPANGIVYAKWCHDVIPSSGNWEITLDLEKCGTYKRSKSTK